MGDADKDVRLGWIEVGCLTWGVMVEKKVSCNVFGTAIVEGLHQSLCTNSCDMTEGVMTMKESKTDSLYYSYMSTYQNFGVDFDLIWKTLYELFDTDKCYEKGLHENIVENVENRLRIISSM